MQRLINEIVERAKANRQRIVLPEGTEERTLKAANQILTDGVADLILLGNPAEIEACAKEWGLGNIGKATIIDPANHPKMEEYAQLLCELRKKKGMTIEEARKLVLDPLYLGCLMIKNGSKTISNVPVQRNYRTNIFGSILTGAVDLGITIDPDFASDHNYEELLLAAQNGGSVTLTEDVTITDEAPIIIDNGITLTVDLNGNTITRADGDNGQSGVWAFRVNNGTLILNDATGTGTLDGGEGLEHSMLWANGANAKIIINSGNYTVGGNPTGNNYNVCVYASNGGQVEIYGGTFENEEPQTGSANLYPALNVSNGSPGTITVYGGTFKNYDPATGDDANGDPFVATGYSSVKVSDDPTPNGTYQVVRGTGAATSTDLANAIESGAELITLVKDVTVGSMGAFNTANTVTIDLNGQTVTMSDEFEGNISQGGEVTFCNGALKSNVNIIISNGKLSLDNVTLDGFEYALNCQGEDAYLEITNSTLKGEYFVLSTNASVEDGTLTWGKDARIILKDSDLEATETAFMNNVPATIEIDGRTFKGNHQGGLLRGGTYIIRNSTFTLNAELPSNHWENHPNDNWEDGNRAVFAGLTIGNRSASSYQYPTNVTLENVTVNVEGTYASEHPAVYVYANQGEGLGVTLNHSGCTFNGDVIYGSANITVNGAPATEP